MLSKTIINKVINETDIVEVISEYVPLQPKGKACSGLPFHDDQNPSMSVSREIKMFNCFSCNYKAMSSILWRSTKTSILKKPPSNLPNGWESKSIIAKRRKNSKTKNVIKSWKKQPVFTSSICTTAKKDKLLWSI